MEAEFQVIQQLLLIGGSCRTAAIQTTVTWPTETVGFLTRLKGILIIFNRKLNMEDCFVTNKNERKNSLVQAHFLPKFSSTLFFLIKMFLIQSKEVC